MARDFGGEQANTLPVRGVVAQVGVSVECGPEIMIAQSLSDWAVTFSTSNLETKASNLVGT